MSDEIPKEEHIKEALANGKEAGERWAELEKTQPEYASKLSQIYHLVECPEQGPNDVEPLLAMNIISSFATDKMWDNSAGAINSERILKDPRDEKFLPGIAGQIRRMNAVLQKDPEEVMKQAMAITTAQIVAAQGTGTVTTPGGEEKALEIARSTAWQAPLLQKIQAYKDSQSK